MIRFSSSQRVRAAFALFATAPFAATSAWAQDLPPLPPPQHDPASPPMDSAPAFPPPDGPPQTPEAAAEVAFAPEEPGLKLFSRSDEVPVEAMEDGRHDAGYPAVYSPICDGPCTTRLEPDAYRLALAKGGRPPVPVSEPVVVDGPSTLRASYTDRSGLRIAGALTAFAGAVAGPVMIVASRRGGAVCNTGELCSSGDTMAGPLVSGGLMVLIVCTTLGLVLMSQHDEAHITVEPLKIGSRAPSREGSLASQPQGVALTLHF